MIPGWKADNPIGRVFTLVFYEGHYHVAQWEPLLERWAFQNGRSVNPLIEHIWWREFPLPPFPYEMHPKVYAIEKKDD